MYICTECQEKFKTKPEYCSCGNDEFRFVKDEDENSNSMEENTHTSSKENLPKDNSTLKSAFSILFFIVCIILSTIIWLIKPEQKAADTTAPQETQKEIPDFDKIWKDGIALKPSSPKPQENRPKTEENKVQKAASQAQSKPKATQSTKNQNPISQVQKTVQTPKVTKPATTKPQSSKVQQPVKIETQSQIKLPQSVKDTIKQTSSTPTQTSKPATTPEITPTQPKIEPTKMSEREFLNYKGAVRSALLANLNVTAIQGSGDCAVEFSVDNTGKLINRNFIYKSSNKTVNDEVYNMLMRLPYYKQPPVHYNGEKIKLKFMFNNGYYEISFI